MRRSNRRHGLFGGHLASTASRQFDRGNVASADAIDRARSRPDFAILGYPVITGPQSTPRRNHQ